LEWANSYEDEEYMPPDLSPHLIPEPELNDLTQDLNLSKIKAEVIASRLKNGTFWKGMLRLLFIVTV
jgi:hypothetical protein